MIRRGGASWPVDPEIASFFEMHVAGKRHEWGPEKLVSSPPGGEPSMKVPDPALHTVEPSEWDERGERG